MADERYIRQLELFNINKFKENSIAIIGCGANGSFIGMALAKMGFENFELYDFDKVEEHNLPNQFFDEFDLGQLKVLATKSRMIYANPKCTIKTYGKYKINEFNNEIVISCVDVMKTRKEIFKQCKESDVQLFIDTRMAGLQGQIYTIDMDDKKEVANYEKTLFSDKEAVQARCTQKSILFTVLGIASIVCNQIVKALNEEEIRNYVVLDYSIPQMM